MKIKTKAAYKEYLKSDHWIALRTRVYKRDGYKCKRCGSTFCIQAHHKLYREKWEDSLLEDLVTLCSGCHKAEHKPVQTQKPISNKMPKWKKKYLKKLNWKLRMWHRTPGRPEY